MQSIRHLALAGFCSVVDGVDADYRCSFSRLAEAAVNRNVIWVVLYLQHPTRTLSPSFWIDTSL